jgi:HB1, ASXL, restriction endonuclease HTH domain
MPHAFKANPDHPAVAYLVRLHADLGGKILENRKQAARLAEAMQHVEAVIRLFDPAYDVRRITARRRYKGNPWFKRGTILRHALDVLRKAQEPLTAREVAERMLATKGISGVAPKTMGSLVASVQVSLSNHEGKAVVRVGEGSPGRWRINAG